MPEIRKRTADINFSSLTVVQMSIAGTNVTFDDVAPSDDLSTPAIPATEENPEVPATYGPYLAFERGIWKYPLQTTGGRLATPSNYGRPLRLLAVHADFGASIAWSLHLAGIDATTDRPANTSGTPYSASHAASYYEGDIIVDSGTGRYLAKNYEPINAAIAIWIMPGQHLYIKTAAISAGIVRFFVSPANNNI